MRQSYPTLPLPLPFRFIHLTKHRSKRNVRPINLYRDKNRSRRVIFVDSTQEKKEETNKGKKNPSPSRKGEEKWRQGEQFRFPWQSSIPRAYSASSDVHFDPANLPEDHSVSLSRCPARLYQFYFRRTVDEWLSIWDTDSCSSSFVSSV